MLNSRRSLNVFFAAAFLAAVFVCGGNGLVVCIGDTEHLAIELDHAGDSDSHSHPPQGHDDCSDVSLDIGPSLHDTTAQPRLSPWDNLNPLAPPLAGVAQDPFTPDALSRAGLRLINQRPPPAPILRDVVLQI